MTLKIKDIIKFKPIEYEDWQRFEYLADLNLGLWKIFWKISNEKKMIKEEKMCAYSYFSTLVFPDLLGTIEMLDEEEGTLEQADVNIIVAVLFGLVPQTTCDNCECKLEYEVHKIEINHDNIGQN